MFFGAILLEETERRFTNIVRHTEFDSPPQPKREANTTNRSSDCYN